MDMQKYKPLYLSEAEEHLDALERELVAIEGDPGAEERIHEVFRHLHSLKSMSASMGYDPISELAHRLEDLVSPHRESGKPLPPPAIDALLQGLDALRERVFQSAQTDVVASAPEDLIEQLIRLADQAGPAEAAAGPATPGTQPQADPPPTTTSGAERDLQVTTLVDPGSNMPAIRAFLAHKRLAEIGQILWSRPDASELKSGQLPERTLRLALRTDRDPEQVHALLDGLAELSKVEVVPLPDTGTGAAVQQPPPEAKPPAASERAGVEAGPSTIRVRTDLLDFFVDSVGELITLRSYFEDVASRLDDPALREGVRRMNSVVRRLQDRVMEVRMVPAALLTDRLPRICRDVARSRGKSVVFGVEGDDVKLDRALVEALQTPFLHLLRNAVEHGIESPAERLAAGKPEEGRLQLSVVRAQDRVLMRLSDDGAGIDLAAIRRRARGAGLLSAGDDPDEADLLDLIFRPGFSTRDGVSDLSGRGVGMDSVRETVEGLGGRIRVETEAGRGTVFTLDLPLTLATLQVLLVQTGEVLLALPAARVLRASALNPDGGIASEGDAAVVLTGRTIPLKPLSRILDHGRPTDPPAAGEMVVVGKGDEPVLALAVDRVTGHQEVVLKVIGRLLRELGPFSGSTILGDGQPVLILDVDALIQDAALLEGA